MQLSTAQLTLHPVKVLKASITCKQLLLMEWDHAANAADDGTSEYLPSKYESQLCPRE
jgi:hypothetical protein